MEFDKDNTVEFEKLDTRLEMQAIFLPDGSEAGLFLDPFPSCDSDCINSDCILNLPPGVTISATCSP